MLKHKYRIALAPVGVIMLAIILMRRSAGRIMLEYYGSQFIEPTSALMATSILLSIAILLCCSLITALAYRGDMSPKLTPITWCLAAAAIVFLWYDNRPALNIKWPRYYLNGMVNTIQAIDTSKVQSFLNLHNQDLVDRSYYSVESAPADLRQVIALMPNVNSLSSIKIESEFGKPVLNVTFGGSGGPYWGISISDSTNSMVVSDSLIERIQVGNVIAFCSRK